jgi:hypothetical protein
MIRNDSAFAMLSFFVVMVMMVMMVVAILGPSMTGQ